MDRFSYSTSIEAFLRESTSHIIGELTKAHSFSLEREQTHAWDEEIAILKKSLSDFKGTVFFEFSIPRMGKRVDAIVIIDAVIFVIEFKVGEKKILRSAVDQVWDYALDLKNFHETSHAALIIPIVVATDSADNDGVVPSPRDVGKDRCAQPIGCNAASLRGVLLAGLELSVPPPLDATDWNRGRYNPTPTIVEAAKALYRGHAVGEISRSDAGENIAVTSKTVAEIIERSRAQSKKSICFVTGVPGAGKTLVGLDIATKFADKSQDLHSIFLSGNGPLVKVLCEALARDRIERERIVGSKITKASALREAHTFIQNVHHFRDECLRDERPPVEHVALFDEAQRAWDAVQTSKFMKNRKGRSDFHSSEPHFLISCLDRHQDWAVIICLVGGGQEIHTGEAGISEWLRALELDFTDWHVYISSRLHDSEYNVQDLELQKLGARLNVLDDLHLATSMRSFRAENLSSMVKQILDREASSAHDHLSRLVEHYPLAITRNLDTAKRWLRSYARGSERYGLIASSNAVRLKPYAIDVRPDINPVHWFLNSKDDVRSSYYLEDVATQFHVQGLELDWACVTWDADFRYNKSGWDSFSFSGDKWKQMHQEVNRNYLKNAYRVLLTRARQGMVIFIPEGSDSDPTRDRSYYDPTFNYLREVGLPVI